MVSEDETCHQEEIETRLPLSSGDDHLLVIGIMSAQDNFEGRQSIRLTWKNLITNHKMQYYFLIGEHVCDIPPQDRIDEYSCREWPVLLEKGVNESTEFCSGSFDCRTESSQAPLFLGFSFITQHQVVVTRLGVVSTLLAQLQHVRVSLREASTGGRITSATFVANKEQTDVAPVILSKVVEAFVLPKGFEGQVLVELDELPELKSTCSFGWTTAAGVIRFLQLIKTQKEKPYPFQENTFTPVVMTFSIHDIDKLEDHIASRPNRQRLWMQQAALLKSKLITESKEMEDTLLLDVVDVYRNLPKKLLYFFQWVYSNQKFYYLLKTDDDTFVDISSVEKELQQMKQSGVDSCDIWWWSSFREGWPVQTAGKWREDAYRSATYPPFPCGAGYVLSYDTVKFLGVNADVLHTDFQGEDVSIGIWLAGLNPCRHNGPNISCVWSCGETIPSPPCNRAQLSAQGVLQAWRQYQQHTVV